MNRIEKLFQEKKNDVLNVYFTAGFPRLNDTANIANCLFDHGVDMIEIGMPYSDPLADGPTIQNSGCVALKNGMNLNLLFDQVKSIRVENDIPIILMGYLNQLLQFGPDRFLDLCSAASVDGLIIPDLPLEVYEKEYQSKLKDRNLAISFLITPQTPADRIRKIDSLCTGFLYVVSSYAITGAKNSISQTQIEYFNRIEDMNLSAPKMIGFGISDHSTYSTACQYAQGAIIGSAFIKHVDKYGAKDANIKSFVEHIRGLIPA